MGSQGAREQGSEPRRDLEGTTFSCGGESRGRGFAVEDDGGNTAGIPDINGGVGIDDNEYRRGGRARLRPSSFHPN